MKSKVQVQLLDFNCRLSNIESKRLKQSGHTRLFHNPEERLFIILNSYYLSKILELKNPVLKFKLIFNSLFDNLLPKTFRY